MTAVHGLDATARALTVGVFAGTDAEWDAFVAGREGATHCHDAAWRRVVERVFGHECLYLAARDEEGALAGVLPLVRVRSRLFGHYVVSMPFLNYGGPLGDADAVRALVEVAERRAREDGAALLELRSRVPLPIDLAVSHRKVTCLLDLPAGDPDALWTGLDAKVRSQVRRPRKEGVEVRFGRDQVRPFFEVFARHMRDLGTPTLPLAFFEAVADAFGDDAWFACAWLGGRPIAGGAGVARHGEFEITWASSLLEHKRIAPNMLLYWELLERAAREGIPRFNFGRCTPGGGTHRFKRQWGAGDEPLWWYHAARGARAATPSPDDSAYRWGPRLWKRLPAPVATALGPMIVRWIP